MLLLDPYELTDKQLSPQLQNGDKATVCTKKAIFLHFIFLYFRYLLFYILHLDFMSIFIF